MSETSASLLDRLRDPADAMSWQRLVDLYAPLIRRWGGRHSLQATDLDDLVQEVMKVVVRRLPDFRRGDRPGAFRAWLRSITVHTLRDFCRLRRFRPLGHGGSDFEEVLRQLEDPDSGLSRLWDEEHDRHVLGRLLELIEPEFEPATWQAFRRVALEGCPTDVVAAELRLSTNAVCIAKSRILKRLRQEARGLIG